MYLRKIDTRAVTEELLDDSFAYQTLSKMRTTETTTIPGTGGFGAGSGSSYTVPAGTPLWEEVAEEDAELPDPSGGRVVVIELGSAAAETEEISEQNTVPEYSGTLTHVGYVPVNTVAGKATNNRTIELKNGATLVAAVAEITKEIPALTELALTLESTHTITAGTALKVISKKVGTGLVDPGGVLYVVYKRS